MFDLKFPTDFMILSKDRSIKIVVEKIVRVNLLAPGKKSEIYAKKAKLPAAMFDIATHDLLYSVDSESTWRKLSDLSKGKIVTQQEFYTAQLTLAKPVGVAVAAPAIVESKTLKAKLEKMKSKIASAKLTGFTKDINTLQALLDIPDATERHAKQPEFQAKYAEVEKRVLAAVEEILEDADEEEEEDDEEEEEEKPHHHHKNAQQNADLQENLDELKSEAKENGIKEFRGRFEALQEKLVKNEIAEFKAQFKKVKAKLEAEIEVNQTNGTSIVKHPAKKVVANNKVLRTDATGRFGNPTGATGTSGTSVRNPALLKVDALREKVKDYKLKDGKAFNSRLDLVEAQFKNNHQSEFARDFARVKKAIKKAIAEK